VFYARVARVFAEMMGVVENGRCLRITSHSIFSIFRGNR
jgi:hypothetical protein